jgi:hypothetical protein
VTQKSSYPEATIAQFKRLQGGSICGIPSRKRRQVINAVNYGSWL